jgi:hypothetical protein
MAIVLSPPLDPLPRPSQFFSPLHSGVDWAGAHGTPILAAAPGAVTYAQWGGGGLEVRIDHGPGIETRYLHLSALLVGRGQQVRAGQRIGLMGATGLAYGTHLHFELVLSGVKVNPLPYLTGGASLGNVQPAPSDRPRAYPLDEGKSCDSGYRPGLVDARSYALIPGTLWFGRPANAQGLTPACVRDDVEEGEGVGIAEDILRVEIDWPEVIPGALNVGVLLAAAVLAWQGVQRILRG